jgi:serine/threonine-protein kinase
MATELFTHPTPDQLRAFALGRLSSAEMAELEQHISYCDSCCLQLARVPDDTLVQLAREAATQGIKSPAAKPVDPPPKPSPGEIPKGLQGHHRYRVLSLVGHGGMGAVYKAEHRKMERLVALKVINQQLLANPQAVERFSREVRAVSKLSHPNIVLVHDADEAGSLHFLVMEFVDGVSLDRVVAHNGPLTPAQAANFIAQAARGLQHAHEMGMVHRDIKPQNLMMTRKKEIKILDFGLARLGQDGGFERAGQGENRPARPGETTAGMVLGTPDYIAPEQAADARRADGRSDIYSLGCTLYYLLTGQPPFPTGTTIEKLSLHLTSPPPSILEKRPDVPAELARILEKMLAKNPQDRYQTPGEVAKDLAPLARSADSSASGRRQPPGNSAPPAPIAAPQDSATIVTTAPAGGLVPVPSTEYSVLSTSLLDDLKLDGSLPTLPPVVQPPSGSGLPFGATPLVAGLLACGIAAAMMLLAWGIAGAFFGDDPTEHSQQAAATSGSEHPTTETPLTQTIPTSVPPSSASSDPPASRPAETSPCPPTYDASGPIGENLPRKVLLVLPSRGLWANDVWQLKPAFLKKGIDVKLASTSLDPPIEKRYGHPVPFVPDLILDERVRGEDYGAVIFAGYHTDDYHPGGAAGDQTSRLISELLEKKHIIASICVGQRVLDAHQLLDGKDVAYCQYIEKDFGGGGGNPKPEGVVKDGQIITAGADFDGRALADVIESHLAR